ncbi:MAG: hypothetical protein OXC37_02170 [Bdellovibrionaceae bacterium]|nr:hypothetical protein [Pseudobdellovibrionaceae bacterium]
MKLKKRDTILSIEKQAVTNKKQVYKILSGLLKNKSNLSLKLKRDSQELIFYYKAVPYKNKKKLTLSQKELVTTEPLVKSANKKIVQEEKKKKKTIVPKKYKPYMQRAYISSSNSFIYKDPDFDSIKLQTLPIGKQVLISKKIFRPSHNFGTFYKIFLFKEKKVIGYVSEAEVIPEFKRKDKKFISNPSFKLAKKYILENKILSLDSIEEIKNESNKSKSSKNTSSNKRKYIGLSIGLTFPYTKAFNLMENSFIGIKFSGYNLLISYLNMDINLIGSYDRRHFYLDILATYPILNFRHYHLFAMGGIMSDLSLNENYLMHEKSIDYGLVGSLSLVIPLNKNMVLRLDGKANYKIQEMSFPLSSLTSLQIAF